MSKPLSLSLFKKVFPTVITSSAFITGCTILVIWFYLSSINRLDVFLDAISMDSSLGIIFSFTLLSFFGCSSVIFQSSVMLVFIYYANERIYKRYSGVAHRLGCVCYINSFFVFIVMMGVFLVGYYFDLSGMWVNIVVIVSVTAFSFWLFNKLIINAKVFSDQDTGRSERLITKKEIRIFAPFFSIVLAVLQMIPIMLLITQLEFEENTSDLYQFLTLAIASLFFIVLGMLPGVVIINERESDCKISKIVWLGIIFVPMGLFAASLFFRPVPDIIVSVAMNMSGISDWRQHQYYIENKNYPHGMFNGYLWNTRYYKDIPDRFFITGVNIFSIGNIKLICPAEINRLRMKSFKDSLFETEEHNNKIKKLQKSAMSCFPFHKDDVHSLDSPMTEAIYYEKVKINVDNSMVKILHALK